MRLEVHRRLREVEAAQGMNYGKIVQKMLALAFLEAGAAGVTERGVQGIDLEVECADGRKVALEVKTTQGTLVLARKDVDGLAARAEEGYEPFLAVLGAGLLDDWVFARHHPGEVRPNVAFLPLRLRPYRDAALEAVVAETFPAVVLRHGGGAVAGGQGTLDEALRRHPRFRPA